MSHGKNKEKLKVAIEAKIWNDSGLNDIFIKLTDKEVFINQSFFFTRQKKVMLPRSKIVSYCLFLW